MKKLLTLLLLIPFLGFGQWVKIFKVMMLVMDLVLYRLLTVDLF
jgi:hypothetical protein